MACASLTFACVAYMRGVQPLESWAFGSAFAESCLWISPMSLFAAACIKGVMPGFGPRESPSNPGVINSPNRGTALGKRTDARVSIRGSPWIHRCVSATLSISYSRGCSQDGAMLK